MYGFYITAGMSLAGGSNDPYYSYLTKAVKGILPQGYGSPSSDGELRPLISITTRNDPDGGYIQFYRFDDRYMTRMPENDRWWHEHVEAYVAYMLGVGEACSCQHCEMGFDCCGRTYCAWVDVWPAGDPGIWWVKAEWRFNI